MLLASSPGKVHFIGEHAVVYGEPAILCSIGLRTYVKIDFSKNISFIDMEWPNIFHSWSVENVLEITEKCEDLWNYCKNAEDFSKLFSFIKENGYEFYRAYIVGIVMKNLNIKEGFSIEVRSEIPTGSGLGSSASRAVAITKAISELFEKNISLEKLNKIAFNQEKIIHGNPSGGDNSACCYGGILWFRKSFPENEIISLKDEIPYKLENFFLVYTKKPEKTTGELVQMVANLDKEYREKRIKEIGRLTKEMREALKKRDFENIKNIINLAQKNLSELGVSNNEIEKLCENVRKIGGAAKLCGAGGGGIVLCYHEDKERLTNLIKRLGYKFWEVDLGVEGVKLEN
jgi:mevalonate kinase